ncbi:glycosyl hydrolase family 76-domain-containing protein [Rhizoctonia solani]|nr:glycosyl hydrolase family 76-domain-containing protein [Rhizoctonia solani]
MTPVISFLLLSLPITASAADLGVPLSWRKFSNERPLKERQDIAQAAIDNIIQYLDKENYEFKGLGYWVSANTYSAVALKDKITGTQVNRELVTAGLKSNFENHPHFYKYDFNDDALWWGTASIYAYQAYNDTTFLKYAIDNWNEASKYQITPAQAQAGKHPLKKDSIKATCDGRNTTAGGVFWKNGTEDKGMNTITTSLFLTLSTYLWDITKDTEKYSTPAILAAEWITNNRYDWTKRLALDSLSPMDCSTSPDSWMFTYNSGKYLEGLSTLARLTNSSKWYDQVIETANAAVKARAWQGEDGIITEGQGGNLNTNDDGRGFKAIFIRALHKLFHDTNNRDLHILIHSYVDVQYNALLDLASNGTSYGVVWHGPYNGPTPWGQNAALDVLVAAIGAN